ncbi:MAG: MbcA/ParS/Xre antitoxin family protein [Gammaproteobacteria bacterium]|jgi:hypothetical protein
MSAEQQAALSDITSAVMRLLDNWKLETREMQAVLALPRDVRARTFNKYREGNATLPDDQQVLRRAHYLLRIADSLRTTYPLNPEMSGRWIRQPHRRFGRRSPLSIILNDGESGLIAVLSELDCTFSWDLTGSKPTTYGASH